MTLRTSRTGRISKDKLVSMLTCDKMWELWPFRPAQALPHHDYENLFATACRCAHHNHGRKDCPLRGKRKCQMCGIAYEDFGSGFQYCQPCTDYWLARRDYLAEWVVLHGGHGQMQAEMPLLVPAQLNLQETTP